MEEVSSLSIPAVLASSHFQGYRKQYSPSRRLFLQRGKKLPPECSRTDLLSRGPLFVYFTNSGGCPFCQALPSLRRQQVRDLANQFRGGVLLHRIRGK